VCWYCVYPKLSKSLHAWLAEFGSFFETRCILKVLRWLLQLFCPYFAHKQTPLQANLTTLKTILSPGRGNTTFLRIQHNLIVIYTKYYCYYERQQIAIFVGRHKTVVVLAYTLDRLDSFIIRVVDHWDENIWIRSGNKLLKA